VKYVSLFMDVEDPINPLADDAARDFGELFSACGVVGSFCVTGEKCRSLVSRGRRDVLDALAPHACGLHTDTHSFHPSTMEMLAECPFEEGCELAAATEGRGRDAFRDAFAHDPEFWGGAGNTWSPEISAILPPFGMGAYVYALTSLPNDAVHRFNGVVAMPQATSISELDWMEDARASAAVEGTFARIEAFEQPWIGLFVGHPTKMRHRDYWDKPFYAGRTPPSPEFSEPVSEAEYARAKDNLAGFLERVQRAFEVVSVPDALALPWRFRAPTEAERDYFVERTSANLRSAVGWPIHRPGLSAENIVAKTLALADTVEVGEL